MRKYCIFLFLINLSLSITYGQSRVDACFSVTKNRFCVGETVVATNCIDPKGSVTTPPTGLFNFGDTDVDTNKYPNQGVKLNSDTSHVYNKPGTYRIKQKGGFKPSTGGVDDTVVVITILPKQLPQFDIGICEGYKVNFKIKDNIYNEYTLVPELNAPSQTIFPGITYTHTYSDISLKSATVKGECGLGVTKQFNPLSDLLKPDLLKLEVSSNGSSQIVSISFNAIPSRTYLLLESNANGIFMPKDTIVDNNGPTVKTYGLSGNLCYKIVNFDECGNADTSEIICTSQISVDPSNNVNKVTWNKPNYEPNAIDNYELYKNGISVGTFSENTFSYVDSEVICGRSYTYNLITTLVKKNSLDGSQVYTVSNNAQATALSTQKPKAIQNLNSTISNNEIILKWEKPAGAVLNYKISKSINGSEFESGDEFLKDSLIADKVNPENHYCYKLSYKDSCNNVADDSMVTCPVILNSIRNADDHSFHIWTQYTPNSTSDNKYILEKLNEDYSSNKDFAINSDTTYKDTPEPPEITLTRYRVKVIINGGNQISYSNIFTLKNDLLIFLPTAFTPNNDGQNDVFEPFGKYIKEFKMYIYNRWGEIIFYSDNMNNGWDGSYKGAPADIDSYVYVLYLLNNAGEKITKTGDVLLLK